jgi:hypothetical protein
LGKDSLTLRLRYREFPEGVLLVTGGLKHILVRGELPLAVGASKKVKLAAHRVIALLQEVAAMCPDVWAEHDYLRRSG